MNWHTAIAAAAGFAITAGLAAAIVAYALVRAAVALNRKDARAGDREDAVREVAERNETFGGC